MSAESSIARPSDALALHHDTVREVLSNGLTLLIRRDASAPVVAIVTHVNAGYFDESDDVVGIAHVLEHMFFKGTPTRGVGEIARETKINGGYLNAHTIYDHTSYYTVLPSAAFVQGLEIQYDAYARSLIDGEELARELEVIIQEAKRKRDTPQAVAIESLYALLHDRHRIRRWRIGDEAGLRALTSAAVQGFYRHWYQPSNTILSIVGDVDIDTVRREVQRRHGALADTRPVRQVAPVEMHAPGFRARDWSGDIAQQQIAFGWRTPPLSHPDAIALDLAGVALGSGRASRLYRAVRERQLASSVSAWNYTAGDVGVFVVHAEAPAAHAREAAIELWRETQSARSHGLRASEIERAQRISEARWLRRLETMDGQATYLAGWESEGGLEAGAHYYDRLLSLDARTVRDAMERHLDPRQASVVSYRPHDAPPLDETAEALQAMLQQVEGMGSNVLPAPDLATLRSNDAVADTGSPDGSGSPAVHVPDVMPHVRRAPHDVQGGVHVYHTTNGIPVLVLPRPGAPIANVGVFQRGGSLAEASGQDGLARLTAQSMLKGTSTRTGARIAEDAEALGASIGVAAGLESLGWTMSVPSRHVETALALLADVTQHPTFPDEGVATERALALAEVGRVRDDMYRWPMRLAIATAYAGHPYGRSVIGTQETLSALGVEQARAFHRRHIMRAATVIGIVGDVDAADIAGRIDEQFSMLAWHDDEPLADVIWPAMGSQASDRRDKQQTAIALLFPGPARTDPARFAARVLSAVASGLGGRFFEQLRDRQSLAYTVSAFPVERRHGGAFAAYIATSPAREDEARAGLLNEFAKLCDAPPTADEITRAKRYLIGTHAISQQSGGAVLGDIVDAWLFGAGLGERLEFEREIDAVTDADVHALARHYLGRERAIEGVVRGTAAG